MKDKLILTYLDPRKRYFEQYLLIFTFEVNTNTIQYDTNYKKWA